jgi:8-oxo-dGTP pyrophosphatase MutT (NUDIX family)
VGFIENLRQELERPLPGIETQLEMAAGNRVFYKEFEKKENPKEGSVLIILYPENNNWHTVFIKRTPDPGPHSGQMAFPGGMTESEDKSLFETALREAEEEVGIDSKQITYIGKLTPLHIPVSNILVHPFIGAFQQRPLLTASKNEVAEIFETPLNAFLDLSVLSFFSFEYKGNKYKAPSYIIGKYTIWGATAMMWNEFLTIYKRIITDGKE